MPNRLAAEKSPYLLQHVDNPVDWMPWGEAAFARARAEQKPIFLSIGYSTCHWCHVMAHESFENPAIAAILNEHFVSIKVDREERPDVDKVYMTYVQAMTGHGGWPLSAWLTPELKPFYGGTYFPPDDRYGRMGFAALLQAIARGWRDEREKLVAEGERAIATLREHYVDKAAAPAAEELPVAGGAAFERGFQHFYESFDPQNGGFGSAPKFPRASNFDFLFRCAAIQGPTSETGAEAVKLATATLRRMAWGGIHDHVGGGYHRYSVDEAWFVPHFEKMLYDQAQIAVNCLEARQATGDERYAWMARDILDYVRRDLTSPEGAFYTAEDADSARAEGRGTRDEGGHAEGAFYVWTAAEVRAVLGEKDPALAEFVIGHFGVEENGNVDPARDPHAEFTGRNILAQRASLVETAKKFNLDPERASERLLAAIEQLRTARARRPRPLRDDKVVTANNGLMISALARAALVLGEPEHLAAAVRAAEFVRRELHDEGPARLYRSWREGRGAAEGFAEDYAYFIQGLLDLYEAAHERRWLEWAARLQATMDARFWDEARGGYFNSAADDPTIVLRLKEDYDGAEPAPSSVAAMNLLRLSAMLNQEALNTRAIRTIEAFRAQWSGTPQAMPAMLCALAMALEPVRQVVLVGDPGRSDFQSLAAVLHERLGPRRVILALTSAEDREWFAARAPWLAEMKPVEGKATAYVCEHFSCQAPVTDAAGLRQRLA
ncbi:MAG TPA: thioredoxin domain-containing protein [Opitutaceae bacterium]|nr:thioredoxin domain-containing protein [Opitutaceae bacterium]HND62312.1 thioredoxin domain-containing protein [Opitutaceae bacterium]